MLISGTFWNFFYRSAVQCFLQVAKHKHGGWVISVRFSHDGSWVASGSADKWLRVFDAKDEQIATRRTRRRGILEWDSLGQFGPVWFLGENHITLIKQWHFQTLSKHGVGWCRFCWFEDGMSPVGRILMTELGASKCWHCSLCQACEAHALGIFVHITGVHIMSKVMTTSRAYK